MDYTTKSRNMLSVIEKNPIKLNFMYLCGTNRKSTFSCYPVIHQPGDKKRVRVSDIIPQEVLNRIEWKVDIIPQEVLKGIEWNVDIVPQEVLDNIYSEPSNVQVEYHDCLNLFDPLMSR